MEVYIKLNWLLSISLLGYIEKKKKGDSSEFKI